MNTYRTHKGPFKERPYFKDQEIETICADELKAVGLFPATPSPIRIDRFIEKRFGVVPSYEDLGKGILGLTRFGKSDYSASWKQAAPLGHARRNRPRFA